MWHITSLPNFDFSRPRLECDIQIFLAGRGKFCTKRLQIVHCKLNYIHYLHNACKCNRWASRIFYLYFWSIFSYFQWFQHFTKIFVTCIIFQQCWALHDVSLPNWMKYCTVVLANISCKKIHFHLSLHENHSIQLQLFSHQDLGFPDSMLAAHAKLLKN